MDDGVGNKLREARARRKLSLQDVEEATKIRGRYLEAIEAEDWGQLPGDTYARAFIRAYASLVGLDGDQLAEEQRRNRGAARPGERLPRVDPKPRRVARERHRRFSPRLIATLVSLAVVAALLAVGLSTGGGSEEGGKAQHRAPAPHVGQAVPVR